MHILRKLGARGSTATSWMSGKRGRPCSRRGTVTRPRWCGRNRRERLQVTGVFSYRADLHRSDVGTFDDSEIRDVTALSDFFISQLPTLRRTDRLVKLPQVEITFGGT